MIKYETQQVEQKIAKTVICDVCKKEFDTIKDDLEVQEFLFINFRGGYNSVFGDDAEVSAEICQHCLDKILFKYLTIK